MSVELLAMLGGSLSGFVMKLIASQAEAQKEQFNRMLQKQGVADDSADRAANRDGQAGAVVRRTIALCRVTRVCITP